MHSNFVLKFNNMKYVFIPKILKYVKTQYQYIYIIIHLVIVIIHHYSHRERKKLFIVII
jgi:hypothetical protein